MSILYKKNIDIPEPGNYDFSLVENDIKSCGLETISFSKRNKELFDGLVLDRNKENIIAVVCHRMENTFSKRELAFLLAKSAIMEFIK